MKREIGPAVMALSVLLLSTGVAYADVGWGGLPAKEKKKSGAFVS